MDKNLLFNPPVHHPLKLYRASAGAGKTHKLTEEFLRLLFKYPDNYRQILAVTFTKKATEEMKSRIMQELHNLAKGEKSGHFKVIKELNEYKTADDSKVTKQAQFILKKILHDFSHFSITTIDSFFQKILTSFFKEIGLHSGYTIEMDRNLVIDKVIDGLLLELGENKLLTSRMVQFSKEKILEGEHWDIEKELKQLSKEIFTEDFKLKEHEIIAALKDNELVEQFQKKLFAIKKGYEKELRNIGEVGLKVMERYQLTVDQFSFKKAGVAGSFLNLINNNFNRDGERVKKAIDSIDAWYPKDSKLPEGTKQAVYNELNALLKKALGYCDAESQKYLSSCEAIKYYNQFGLLSEILRKLQDYRDNEQALLMSDIAYFLRQITAENDSSFIFEKTANWYKHYIIDEFQDTSLFQWDNFKPLIENSLAEGTNLNMIVGDVKQSIYRWRGGNWTLINNRIEQEINEVEPLVLNENWRSGVNIIKFNNSLFESAASILQHHFDSALPTSFKDSLGEKLIEQVYEKSMQNFPLAKNDHGGYVQIKFYEQNEEEDLVWKDLAKRNLVSQIDSFKKLNYRLSDMAVLVRNNKEAKEIADILLQNSIDVISSESLSLGNSIAVRILVGAIRYINEPMDAINLAMLIYEYTHYINKEPFSENLLHELFSNPQPTNLKSQLYVLLQMPLYELAEELIRILDLSVKQEELPYLQTFQDAILNYSRNKKNDLASFLEWWGEYGKKKTVFISEGQNAVQIMTIHKSKGLSFKIVFMPFCNWKIETEAQKANILWVQSNHEPFNEIPYFPVKYTKELAKTYFAPAYYQEMLNGFIDNLNLLYVASTRAIDAMVILAPKPKIGKDGFKISTVADVLYAALSKNTGSQPDMDHYVKMQQHWNPETGIFELGEIKANTKTTELKKQFTLNMHHSYTWRNRITIRRHAKDYFSPLNDASADKVNYGTLMHEVLKNIQLNTELEQVLESMYIQGKLSVEQKLHLANVLQNFLNLAEVKPWFSGKWKVKNERAILLGSGKIKIPDKVLIDGTSAIVIDFKTGKESAQYEKQIKEYMGILQQMGYEQVSGFLAYIEERKIVSV